MAKLFVTLAILYVFGAVLVKGSNMWSSAVVDHIVKFHECKEEVGATNSDFDEIMKKIPPTTMAGKCFRACIMKKYELMDDNGKLSVEAYLLYFEKMAGNSNKILEIAPNIVEKCSEINVSDDHCEAALQYEICFNHEAMVSHIEGEFNFLI